MLVVSFGAAPAAWAGDLTNEEMRSLDERVQAIKSDVLEIAAELTQLEEKLLYPSNTQVAVFVSMSDGQIAALDSLEIQFDGEPVAHHIYSYKELEALGKGGVQRIYTGNLSIGDHDLEVLISGTLPSGRSIALTQRFTIDKQVKPRLVTLELAKSESGEILVELGDG